MELRTCYRLCSSAGQIAERGRCQVRVFYATLVVVVVSDWVLRSPNVRGGTSRPCRGHDRADQGQCVAE